MKMKLLFTLLTMILVSTLSFSQDFYLGVGTPIDQQGTSCASCHTASNIAYQAPYYDTWKFTKHAQAYDSLKGELSYSCLPCHTTGWDTSIKNYGADEYVKADTSAPHGYVITDSAQFFKKVNVQCEDCHGPLGDSTGFLNVNHWPSVTNSPNKPSYSAQLCGKCHSGSHNPFYEEWSKSPHAMTTSGSAAFAANNKACARCHVAQNFVDYMKDPSAYKDTILVTGSEMQPITCVACHDPHNAKYPAQLREGVSYKKVICDECHYAEMDSVNINSTPHEQSGLALSGDKNFGYRYPGQTYINSAHTYAATERCINCHVNMSPNADGSTNVGHTFLPRVQACEQCHSDYATSVDIADSAKMFDYRGIQTTTDSLMNILQGLLSNATSADSATKLFKEANYNLLAVQSDGSHGVHNARLIDKLLSDAIHSYTTTGIKQDNNIPMTYSLSQNYPNPFNPVTTIKFTIPQGSNVKIVIYDAIGRQVTTLTNAYYSKGEYKVEWNADSYASGIYFYRIEAKNFSLVKKMVLLK